MSPRKKQPADLRREVAERIQRGRVGAEFPSGLLDDVDPPDEEVEVPDDRPGFTANQLVAYNLQRARKARGWSQEDLGSFLGFKTGRAWSKASVSAAETSWRPGRRPRKFDANEVLAFARVLRLPVGYFYLPPDTPEAENAAFLIDDPGEVGVEVIRRNELVELVEMTPMPAEYVDRVRAEHRRGLIAWEPATFAREIPGSRPELAHIVGLLRSSGVNVREVLEGLEAGDQVSGDE